MRIAEPKRNAQSRREAGLRYAREASSASRPHGRDRNLSRAERPAKKKKKKEGPGLIARGLRVLKIFVAGPLALTVLSLALVVGYKFAVSCDYFAVSKVNIIGMNQINERDILALTGLDKAVSCLVFDEDEAAQELLALPWLADVKVSKTLPNTVNIEIVEHSPKILVNLGRLHYMNDKGEPFKEVAPHETPNLPILTGIKEDELLSPGATTKAALSEVFWLTDALAQRNDEFRLDNISEINYDTVRGLTLFTKKTGLEVKVGFGSYEEKFRRLGRVMAHLKINGKVEGLVYLNLEASPRVTVRYAEGMLTAARRGG